MSDLTDKEELLQSRPRAVCLTRTGPNGKPQFRISPEPILFEGHIPHRGFLSNWVGSEDRAWHAALCRRWHQVYSKDSTEFE